MRPLRRSLSWVVAILLTGCATTPPYVGQGPYPQIRRGRPNALVDGLGNVLGIPAKIVLWSWKVNNHDISAHTEQFLVDYLEATSPFPALDEARFRINEYAPIDELKRLVHNHHVAWPYRLLLGLPLTLIFEVLLPGRLLGGDHYNPFTNSVHLYSDDGAIALHEAGHAHDTAQQRFKGTYATLRLLPGVDLFQEYVATDKAITYFIAEGDRTAELHAYTILYPAYGTYLGSYLLPFGNFLGAAVGHVWGRLKARSRRRYYELVDPSTLVLG